MGFKRFVDVVEILAGLAAVVAVVFLFFGGSSTEVATTYGEGSQPETGSIGAAVYQQNCTGCHGPQGQGGIGPQLGGGAVVASLPDPEDQIAVVTNGRGGMRAFGGRLTTEEIAAVVEYTRTDLGG